jgi:hypothetical protein
VPTPFASGTMLDVIALANEIATYMGTVRTARGLPALVAPPGLPAGAVAVGKEWLMQEWSPPRVILVPTTIRLLPARQVGGQPMAGLITQRNPKELWRAFVAFEAHLWGDPDPAFTNVALDFNSSLELFRELYGALYNRLGGPPNLSPVSAQWEQPTNDVRMGRLLVATFEVGVSLADEPWTTLPYSTASQSGVQVHATVVTLFPDGQSSSTGVIIAPGNTP